MDPAPEVPALSATSRAFLGALAEAYGQPLDDLVQGLLPLPGTPDDEAGLVVDAAGEIRALYWLGHPHRYLAYRTRNEVPADERDLWDLVHAIEERAAAGGYATRLIPFDPRCDTTPSACGKDWTVDPGGGPRVRAIPAALLEACAPPR